MNVRDESSAHTDLVAHLGHELRAPLAIVVGYAELLRRRDDPKLREEASEAILDAAERLATAIDDTLVVFAAETGALIFDPVVLSLDAVVDEAIDVIRGKNGPRCRFEVQRDEAGPVEVEADEEHLKSIVFHLLANAARRAPDKSVVGVTLRRASPFGEIAVADAGPVVDDVEAVFELYAVRCLVGLHSGRVQATRNANGTVFSATLPLAVP